MRTNIGSDQHVHERFAHFNASFVEPRLHVIDTFPAKRLFERRFKPCFVVGKVYGNHARIVLRCIGRTCSFCANSMTRGGANDAVMDQEHAYIGCLFAFLGLCKPRVHIGFFDRHDSSLFVHRMFVRLTMVARSGVRSARQLDFVAQV